MRLPNSQVGLLRHLVAETADGRDELWVTGIGLDLGSETLHVDVEGLGVPDVVVAPHTVDEIVPGCLLYTSDAADE